LMAGGRARLQECLRPGRDCKKRLGSKCNSRTRHARALKATPILRVLCGG
jgi:hypothetical protein